MSEVSMVGESASRLFSQFNELDVNGRVQSGDFPKDVWSQIEDAGYAMALAPEPHGFGLSMAETLPVFREQGYWNVPAPLAETMVGLTLMVGAGLPPPSGPGTVVERTALNSVSTTGSVNAMHISGQLRNVPWARHAQWLLVELADQRLAVIDMTVKSGIDIQPGANAAGLPADTVRLEHVAVLHVLDRPHGTAQSPIRVAGAMLHCAMMVGVLERTLQQTVQYANERSQFGRLIGRNQVIQQQLAYVAGEIAAARMATLAAASDFDLDDADALARTVFGVAAAKVICGEAATKASAVAHQVHGAIGFTREHALHLSTRRLWSWRESYGTDAWWAGVLGDAAIRAQATPLWSAVVDRKFPADFVLA